MKVLFDIGHPAHVHLFKNAARKLTETGHHALFSVREKDHNVALLKSLPFNFFVIGKNAKGFFSKAVGLLIASIKLYGIIKREKVDAVFGVSSMYAAISAKFAGIPSYIFDDTEHSTMEQKLYEPFATFIFTPYFFSKQISKKQILYRGFHELAYLHPNYFEVKPMNITERKKILLRFVSWGAFHDNRTTGISTEEKIKWVEILAIQHDVVISSESELPTQLKKYEYNAGFKNLHSQLATFNLYIGEGATLASECAVLGVPTIYINPLQVGYIKMQSERYRLSYILSDADQIIEKAKSILCEDRNQYIQRANTMIQEHIDTTSLIYNIAISRPTNREETTKLLVM